MLDRIVRTLKSVVVSVFTRVRTRFIPWVRTSAVPWAKANPRKAMAGGGVAAIVILSLALSGDAAAPEAQASAAAPPEPELLFDPEREGTNPEWSLPAKLSTAEMRGLVHEVEKLRVDLGTMYERLNTYESVVGDLGRDYVRNAFWNRLVSQGFRDQGLPLLYYEVVKDHSGALSGVQQELARITRGVAGQALYHRLGQAQLRLLGGRFLTGDKLFVSTLRGHVNEELKLLDEHLPKAEELKKRTAVEFQEPAPAQPGIGTSARPAA